MLLSEKEKNIMTHEELYKKHGQELESVSVGTNYWTGVPNHHGEFTDNNPYYQQYKQNPYMNNEDSDALYAQAVQWQANYYNTLEEREYNDPANKLARDKRAGINSDILASNGGSASSSSVGSAIPPVQSDVQFSSVGSRTGRVLEGINTACNLVSTIASFGTATIGAIKDIKTMPAEVSLADTQANIAEETKSDVIASAGLANISQRLALVGQLSSYFTPESTTEDYTNVLSTLGIGAEQIPEYESAIRNYHKNPTFKANYEDAVSRATEGAVRNSIRTSDVLNTLYENTLAIEKADQSLTMLTQSIEMGFNQYLADNGYGEQVASNITGSEKAKSQALDLTRMRLKRDVEVFAQNLEDCKSSVHRIDAQIQVIATNAKNEGRMISDTEQFEIDTLTNLRNQLMTLGSSQLQYLYTIMNNANSIMYQNAEMLTTDGNPIIDAAAPRYLRTINTTFGNMVTSNTDVLTSLIGSVPFLGSIFTGITSTPREGFPMNDYSYTTTH